MNNSDFFSEITGREEELADHESDLYAEVMGIVALYGEIMSADTQKYKVNRMIVFLQDDRLMARRYRLESSSDRSNFKNYAAIKVAEHLRR